ncbi:hypothetical protein ACFHW2_33620 [Actinomadura sp. LOL_016]|uniref:hypothetical protein n=1 Tax=unclassified Actinomadura TaxID=2626254 RepID=UPI003A804BF9
MQTVDPESAPLRQPHMAPFQGTLHTTDGARELTPDTNGLPVAARNPAALYRRVAEDLSHQTATAPTFEEAVALHRRLDELRSER